LYSLHSADVEVTACKPAEDGDGYIMRLADVHGRGAACTLTWLGQQFAVELSPFEVQTLRLVQDGQVWQMQKCDMLERAAEDSPAL
jgi:alpha-mannosidase